MQIARAIGLDTGNGEEERDHAIAIVCAEGMTANFIGDDEETLGQQLDVGKSPDFLLQLDRFLKLGDLCQGPQFDHSALACCHSASISSKVALPGVLPPAARPRSTWEKRLRNFALVL